MMHPRSAIALVAGAAGLLAAAGSLADADEAWLHRALLPAGVQPLIVVLFDTSEAASGTVAARPAYDPAQDYSASVATASRCDPARVYWRRGPGPVPDCASQAGLASGTDDPERGFHCDAARTPLARTGFFVSSRAAQWRDVGHWASLDESASGAVECRADRGRHGAAAGVWYAADGAGGPWSGQPASEIRWDRPPLADPYIFYLGNFLNYLQAALPPREISIAELAGGQLANALQATDGLAGALMRFPPGPGTDGGYVVSAAATAAEVGSTIRAMADRSPSNSAPLGELLSEAAAWLAGSAARFGQVTGADPQAFDGTGGRYRSPFSHACRPITLAMLTAGVASGDESAAEAAAALTGFLETTGGCGADCLAALAQYLRFSDLRPDTTGRQSAQLLWIVPSMRSSGFAGGAEETAVSRTEDPSSYINLVARAHQYDAAVPAGPALSAAGLAAGAASGPGLAVIYGMTAARAHERWLGNVFRYGLRPPDSSLAPPVAVDRDGEPALDPATGLPRPGSRSDWSDSPDADLLAGGVSGRLPLAPARRVFSDLASTEITDSRNRLTPDNALIDRARMGLGAADPESPAQVMASMLSARPIGDPGARSPVVVGYRAEGLAIAFVPTQDGLLHAFDAASGVERWAWMPRALLPRLARLMRDEATTARSHGIDGALVVHRFDPDGNGVIERDAGEHLWLMFGLGRGGNSYYALDIADPDQPRLLWSQESAADDAEPGAEPVIARLAIEGVPPSGGNWIVLLAGGRSLRLLDAATGSTLWSAAAADADLLVPELTETLASAPRALDLDGDGQLDRAYLLDLTGGLWRFEFTPGAAPAGLARARRIARLGTGTRHFQASPDVSIASILGRREIAIAAGSGRVDRPREVTAIDRAYVVFDRGTQRELLDSDLHDATEGETAMPAASPGWFLGLDRHGPGEKVIGPSVTFDHVLRFQTYQPSPGRADEPCGPPRALLRRYARDIRSGLPVRNAAGPDGDEEMELEGPGLPVELRFAFPSPADAPCPGCRARPFGIAGARTFDPGYAGDPVRTSWRELQSAPDSR